MTRSRSSRATAASSTSSPVPPGGKALALNAGVAHARFDIVVFADARQVFAHDALRQLVAPFADPPVGAVTGELLLDAESPCRRSGHDRRHAAPRGWRRSRHDRREARARGCRCARRSPTESASTGSTKSSCAVSRARIDSTLGATGAIYAVRRSLFRPLPADTILDDVLTPMRVVLAGYRVVFNEKALAFDRAAADADAEARRKVRTLAGNYQILALEPRAAPAVAQSRVAAVRLAQARAADRALRDAGDLRGQHGARGRAQASTPPSLACSGALLPAGRRRRDSRVRGAAQRVTGAGRRRSAPARPAAIRESA